MIRTMAWASASALVVGLGVWLGTSYQGQSDRGQVDEYWARALQEVYRSPGELQAQHEQEVRKGVVYKKLLHGNPNVRAVALTFDDGPHPQYTAKLLAVLKRYNVKATFFVVGKMAEQYPDLVKAEHAAGHIVGNHTYHHVNLTRIPSNLVRTEWDACDAVIKSILGIEMAYCRPPGGDYDREVITAAADTGLTTVLWTDDPADYAQPGDRAIETRVLDRVGPGGIILLHDGVQQTIDVLPQIIEVLQRKGYRFETVDEMVRGLQQPRQ
jgi:peptidoglycan-N-acetylglucosamine deacetylase